MDIAPGSPGSIARDEGYEIEEEKRYFRKVVHSFIVYHVAAHRRLERAERNFMSIPMHHQQRVPGFRQRISRMFNAVLTNQSFLRLLIPDDHPLMEGECLVRSVKELNALYGHDAAMALAFDVDKTITTLKQFARDWSNDGEVERNVCYNPIIDAIMVRFPDVEKRKDTRILVPGCGLARLPWEFAHKGFTCQGNEVSFHMLFGSSFVLNSNLKVKSISIYPWVHQLSNTLAESHQTSPVLIPDVKTNDIPSGTEFSMAAGEFVDVYWNQVSEWDAITTCFFMDTARNIVAYVETVWRALRPGGVWVNLGPLLYHFSDTGLSVELTYDEFKAVIFSYGFLLEEEKLPVSSPYVANPHSMSINVYHSAFFVMRKPFDIDESNKNGKNKTHEVIDKEAANGNNKIHECDEDAKEI